MPTLLPWLLLLQAVASASAFVPVAMRGSPAVVSHRPPVVRLVESTTPAPDLSEPVSDVELAEQSNKLEALSAKWKKREDELEYADYIRSGFGPNPERINGRAAMFFILTGLVTEYYTGQSLPQQVYTMLQTLSIVE